jgi:hypothetical protein
MSRLITASLISSVDWLRTCPDSWKERAYEGLRSSLARGAWKPTLAIKKGIAFENDVYKIIGDSKGEDGLIAFADTVSPELKRVLLTCRGGVFQNKNKEYLDIDDAEYCIYGKEDVLFKKGSPMYDKGHILDIKTSGKWGGRSKYLNTWQHKLYCYIERIPTFQYLVAVWEDALTDSRKIASIHTADYEVPNEDFDALREEVIKKVRDTVSFLAADEELWSLYLNTFSMF